MDSRDPSLFCRTLNLHGILNTFSIIFYSVEFVGGFGRYILVLIVFPFAFIRVLVSLRLCCSLPSCEKKNALSLGAQRPVGHLGNFWASTSFLLLGPPGASQKGQMHEVACRRNLLSRV